jgi:hypothetical protein
MEKYTLILIVLSILILGCDTNTQPKSVNIIIDEGFRGWVVLRIANDLHVNGSLGIVIPSNGYAVIPSNLFPEKYVTKYFFKRNDGILLQSSTFGHNIIHGQSIYSIDSDVSKNGASEDFHIFFVGSELEYENAPTKSDWLDHMKLK